MKKLLFASVAVAALGVAGVGHAADLPARGQAYAPEPAYVPTVPVFTWTGFYAGVNGGGNWGTFRGGGHGLFGTANGGLVGGTVGYNYQMGHIVVGAEGDLDYDSASGSRTLTGPAFGSAKLNSLMTARARVGYAVDRALLYVTGGYAGGNVSGSLYDTSLPVGAQYFSTNAWHSGYTFGGGIEYAFTSQISAKAEYLFSDLSSQAIFSSPRTTNVGARENIVRAGLNYHF